MDTNTTSDVLGARARVAIEDRRQPLRPIHRCDPEGFTDEPLEDVVFDLARFSQGHEPGLAEVCALKDAVRILHEDAVLEPEVDVLGLRPDERDVADPAADRRVIADEAPARPDRFDSPWERPLDDAPQRVGRLSEDRPIRSEEFLGRHWVAAHRELLYPPLDHLGVTTAEAPAATIPLMATVVLIGTLDTKGEEYEFLRDRIRAAGADVLLVDTGVMGPPLADPDVGRHEVALAAGTTIEALASTGDRGVAIEAMARGAVVVIRRLHAAGNLDAIAGLGGSGGAAIISQAMQALPVGVPKLLVSTMVAGDTRPYVGIVDLTLMYPVVDIAGLNRLSERILANAAAAIVGMAGVAAPAVSDDEDRDRLPLVGATMFGVTTACVTVAREWLESRGYEVLVFHATGTGGRAMEGLMRAGYITAVLDVTTTELADELVGGVLSAGPDRLEAAGELGLPQVVSLGALDMVNFGPPDTVPDRFRARTFYQHNPSVTLMRTTPDECAELGRIVAAKLSAARGPASVFVPAAGFRRSTSRAARSMIRRPMPRSSGS